MLAGERKSTDGAIRDPCLYHGFSRSVSSSSSVYEGPDGSPVYGTADSSGMCLNQVKSLFQPKTCDKYKSVSFGCVYQPRFLAESLNILVFENFYYMASGIGIMPAGHAPDAKPSNSFPLVTSISEMEESAREVCGYNWTQVNLYFPKDASGSDNNIKFCFVTSLMTSFLSNGLGIGVNKHLTIQQSVGGADIEWALGAAYKEAADLLKRDHNLRGASER